MIIRVSAASSSFSWIIPSCTVVCVKCQSCKSSFDYFDVWLSFHLTYCTRPCWWHGILLKWLYVYCELCQWTAETLPAVAEWTCRVGYTVDDLLTRWGRCANYQISILTATNAQTGLHECRLLRFTIINRCNYAVQHWWPRSSMQQQQVLVAVVAEVTSVSRTETWLLAVLAASCHAHPVITLTYD